MSDGRAAAWEHDQEKYLNSPEYKSMVANRNRFNSIMAGFRRERVGIFTLEELEFLLTKRRQNETPEEFYTDDRVKVIDKIRLDLSNRGETDWDTVNEH